MALCAIVDEIMSSETDAAITYSNDDSSMSGVGSYVVQSLTINGVKRSLPTLAIFTESRETLKISSQQHFRFSQLHQVINTLIKTFFRKYNL